MSKTTRRNYLDHQIPAELRELQRWCNWRLDANGKKEPLNGASCTDPATWLTYEEARDRWLNANGDGIRGLWFATGPVEDGDELAIAGFDLDHCVAEDGEIRDPRVEQIIRRLATYAEYSPTDGVRILGWFPVGTRSIRKEKLGFEFYASKRWLSITGNANLGAPRSLDVFTEEVPRSMFEFWTSESGKQERPKKERPAKAEAKPAPPANAKPKPARGSGRRFEDAGVPVDRMVKVAKKCLKLLTDERADDRGEWVAVMCSLKWIEEQTGTDLAKTWHKFSKRCPAKYDREDAQKVWDLYEAPPGDERLTLASLLYWASEDSGKAVAEIAGTRAAKGTRSKSKRSGKRGWSMATQTASNVEMEAVRWLWKGRIPRAKLTILAGDMGDGKSFVCADLAARLSKGIPFPDGFACPTGEILIVNTEDDPADTTVPRLFEAGADLAKIEIYFGIENNETGEKGRLDLARDLPLIEDFLEARPETQLVIVDPIGSFSGDRNLNAYHEVYTTLGPLNELASRYDTAILGIVHMNKAETLSAKHRVTGSTAILAAARCAWIVLRDPDSEDKRRRLFLPLKQNNSAGDDTGLAFRITADDPDGVAHIEWSDETVEATADEVLRRATAVRGEKQKDPDDLDAVRFLREVLKDGPVDSRQVESEARAYGISLKTCKRHKDKLDITVRRVGGFASEGHWEWCLPEHLETKEDT